MRVFLCPGAMPGIVEPDGSCGCTGSGIMRSGDVHRPTRPPTPGGTCARAPHPGHVEDIMTPGAGSLTLDLLPSFNPILAAPVGTACRRTCAGTTSTFGCAGENVAIPVP